MTTPEYTENQELQDLQESHNAAEEELNQFYGTKQEDGSYSGVIGEFDEQYKTQIDAVGQWANTQMENQQAVSDFTIAQIEQQKAQAKKDYTKEQSGAYADWQKQSSKHGVNAEVMAAQGMTNTGYSESSKVSMYNSYQNRVAIARESYDRAVVSYNNAMTEARLQNNAALAEIAYQALRQQTELIVQSLVSKQSLLTELADRKTALDNEYWDRYQDVLTRIQQNQQFEASMAENQRQFDMLYSETDLEQTSEESESVDSETTIDNTTRIDKDIGKENVIPTQEDGEDDPSAWQQIAATSEQVLEHMANNRQKGKVQSIIQDIERANLANSKNAATLGPLERERLANMAAESVPHVVDRLLQLGEIEDYDDVAAILDHFDAWRPKVKEILNGLEMMKSQPGAHNAIKASLIKYMATGEITWYELEYLFNHFGYDPNQVLIEEE